SVWQSDAEPSKAKEITKARSRLEELRSERECLGSDLALLEGFSTQYHHTPSQIHAVEGLLTNREAIDQFELFSEYYARQKRVLTKKMREVRREIEDTESEIKNLSGEVAVRSGNIKRFVSISILVEAASATGVELTLSYRKCPIGCA